MNEVASDLKYDFEKFFMLVQRTFDANLSSMKMTSLQSFRLGIDDETVL